MGRKSNQQKELEKSREKAIFSLELLKVINNYKHEDYELSNDDKLAVMSKIIYRELDNK